MELRRFLRAPLLLIAVAVLLLLFVLDYANSGSSYKQVDTSQIVKLIDQGQVKSALITDKNQTIQITTKSGQNLEASWVSGQGLQLQNKLQDQYNKGNPARLTPVPSRSLRAARASVRGLANLGHRRSLICVRLRNGNLRIRSLKADGSAGVKLR